MLEFFRLTNGIQLQIGAGTRPPLAHGLNENHQSCQIHDVNGANEFKFCKLSKVIKKSPKALSNLPQLVKSTENYTKRT